MARPAPRLLSVSVSQRDGKGTATEMSWLKNLIERDRKSEPKVETPKQALQIQELETRVAPNAIWGE
jgi:hypothetical protein